MADILDEAKEEARLEAIQNFLKTHMQSLIIGVVVVLLATGGYALWQNKRTQNAETAAVAFVSTLEALSTSSSEVQQKKLAVLFTQNGYGDLAKMIATQLLSVDLAAKKPGVMDQLKTFIDDKKMDRNLHQFLVISLANAFLSAETDLTPLKEKLEEISQTNGFLKGFAQESLGLWHLQQKDYAKAHAIFLALSKDGLVSDQTRSRADIFRRQLECEDKC